MLLSLIFCHILWEFFICVLYYDGIGHDSLWLTGDIYLNLDTADLRFPLFFAHDRHVNNCLNFEVTTELEDCTDIPMSPWSQVTMKQSN